MHNVMLLTSSLYGGGAERVIATLAERLDPRRFRVTVAHLKERGHIGDQLAETHQLAVDVHHAVRGRLEGLHRATDDPHLADRQVHRLRELVDRRGRPEARLELARRYLHVFGPTTPEAFARWAGIGSRSGFDAFGTLGRSLTPVRTPVGEAWILSRDEALFRAAPDPAAPARLLPSGDTWFLLQGADRELLLPDESQRRALWTSRVWPGALLVEGETVGVWRRAGHVLTIQPWRSLSRAQQKAVEAEAVSLPLPGIERAMEVRWEEH